MESLKLHQLADQVTDAVSFKRFVLALIADRENLAVRDEWENDTIEDFLESALAWAEGSDFGRSQHSGRSGSAPRSDWQAFAIFLCSGKTYE